MSFPRRRESSGGSAGLDCRVRPGNDIGNRFWLCFSAWFLAALMLLTSGCDAEEAGVKAAVNAYYDAVARGDAPGQVARWLPERRAEAAQAAALWARRDKDALKLDEVHVDTGPAADQRVVHVTLSTDDKARPGKRRYESRVLLVQSVQDGWRIRDVR